VMSAEGAPLVACCSALLDGAMKDDCRPRVAHRLWAYSVQYTCGS
jgi:hypothetical protein